MTENKKENSPKQLEENLWMRTLVNTHQLGQTVTQTADQWNMKLEMHSTVSVSCNSMHGLRKL